MGKKFLTLALMSTMALTTLFSTGLVVNAEEATEATESTNTIAKQDLNTDMVAKVFDAEYYANEYSDVAEALGTDPAALLAHYINFGIYEGRDASESFNASIYTIANPDLLAAYGENFEGLIEHFLTFGINENRVATPAAFGALTPSEQIATISQSSEYLSENGSDIGKYTVTYGGSNSANGNSFDDAYSSSLQAWANSGYSADDVYTTTADGKAITIKDLALAEAYHTQNVWYNPSTGTTQAYGTTVYSDEVDEWGGRMGTKVSPSGIVSDVYNITSEGWDAKAAAMGAVEVAPGVWEQQSTSSSSDSSSSSSSSSDNGSSSSSSSSSSHDSSWGSIYDDDFFD